VNEIVGDADDADGDPMVEHSDLVVERVSDGVVVVEDRPGRVLRAIAVGGVVVAVFLTVVAWNFLGDLERDVDQSLRIGEDAAATLSETIDLAAGVIAAVDSGIATLDGALDAVDAGLGDASDVAAATSELSVSVADSFDDVDVALAQIESLSSTIDRTLRSLSSIPLAPDYDPDVSYPDAVAELRAAFEPIDAEMRTLAAELDEFSSSSAAIGANLDSLQTDLDDARTALADSDRLLDEYRVAATEAGELAERSRDDLGSSMWWARFTAVLLGVWIVAAQYVPWWLADQARGRPRPAGPE
jgi:hypothetical protein